MQLEPQTPLISGRTRNAIKMAPMYLRWGEKPYGGGDLSKTSL